MLVDATDYSIIHEKKSNRTCGAHGCAPNPVACPGGGGQDALWQRNCTLVYFAPEDGVAKHVLQRLEAATRSITFMTFSCTADDISEAIIAKIKAGLAVRGVFESQNAGGSGADFKRLKQGGVDVLEDGNCYILHHKAIVIDERTVITGSYNFTSSAERDSDESLMIVDAPNLARSYLDEFQRVYAQAQAPTRCR